VVEEVRSGVLVLDPSRPVGEAVVEVLVAAGIDARWGETWSDTPPPALTLCAADLLATVPAEHVPRVVPVVADLTVPAVRDHLRQGMPSVVGRDWPLDRICHVVAEAVAGRSVLPSDLLRDVLVAREHPVDLDLTAAERSWLEAFAEGRSCGWVARQAHISERQLYRRLHGVYERLGVTNRSAAIAVLSRYS
jgi:DNA-binding NarL/FixJ family response regulator